MNQRVNITYSVPLTDLSEEVARLIENAYHNMEEVMTFMRGFKDPLTITTYNQIDDTRQKLAALDAGLSDINNIVSSYLSYKVSALAPNPAVEESPLTSPGEGDEKIAEVMNTLQEKMTLFKQQVAENEVTDQATS